MTNSELSPEEYYTLVGQTYKLIMNELKQYETPDKQEFIAQAYPKLVVMYEFFRLLRGEAFTSIRPPVGKDQPDFYTLEDEIRKKLEYIQKQLDPKNERVQVYINEMKSYFDIK